MFVWWLHVCARSFPTHHHRLWLKARGPLFSQSRLLWHFYGQNIRSLRASLFSMWHCFTFQVAACCVANWCKLYLQALGQSPNSVAYLQLATPKSRIKWSHSWSLMVALFFASVFQKLAMYSCYLTCPFSGDLFQARVVHFWMKWNSACIITAYKAKQCSAAVQLQREVQCLIGEHDRAGHKIHVAWL